MKLISSLLLLLLLGLLTSCSAKYLSEAAVADAREYALENSLELEETKRDFVRYTPPKILQSIVLYSEDGSQAFNSKGDMVQTCMIWDIPGVEKSMVVVGVSERRLENWSPIRLIWKKFEAADEDLQSAIRKTRYYVMNKMLFLSDSDRNRVRFALPTILKTKFDLSDKIKKPLKLTRGKRKKRRKKRIKRVQLSMVWDSDDPSDRIVVSGISKSDYSDWAPLRGSLMKKTELDAKRVKSKP